MVLLHQVTAALKCVDHAAALRAVSLVQILLESLCVFTQIVEQPRQIARMLQADLPQALRGPLRRSHQMLPHCLRDDRSVRHLALVRIEFHAPHLPFA